MDLLFKRYASPFLLLNQMIQVNRLSDFIDGLVDVINEEEGDRTLWEFYLHHEFITESFESFKKKVSLPVADENDDVDLGTTVKISFDMLSDFEPE